MEHAGTSIGPISLFETTHVHRPELKTVRELNSREFIPVFKWEWSLILCPSVLNVIEILFLTHVNSIPELREKFCSLSWQNETSHVNNPRMVFFGLWEASSQKVSNLKQFFSFTHELIAVRKFGISKTVVSVESTWCIPDFQHVRKFHVVFHRPWGTTSTKWLWSDCVGKQENRTAEVSEKSLYLLELVMFPMCTSNDPARFALKRKFSHYLKYLNRSVHVYYSGMGF